MLVPCCLLIPAVPAAGQTAPGAPTNLSPTAAAGSLALTWTAPAEDGGAAITGYDLRFIESDSTSAEKIVDANWTEVAGIWSSGTLSHTLSALTDSTGYDVQLRATNPTSGAWSASVTATTLDHGDQRSSATALTLGSSLPGNLSSTSDEDYFSFAVTGLTYLWAHTTGDADTIGTLYESDGTEVRSDDDGLYFPEGPFNFSLNAQLDTGTYYIKVSLGDDSPTGRYRLHAQAVTDPGHSLATATPITPDSTTPGLFGNGTDGTDDFFKLVLDEPTDLWFMTYAWGWHDTRLLDASGTRIDIAQHQWDSYRFSVEPGERRGQIMGRETGPLAAGTYYIQVNKHGRGLTSRTYPEGPYVLFVREIGDPADDAASAAELSPLEPQTGRLSTTTDADYFKFTLAEETYLGIELLHFTFPSSHHRPLEVTVLDGADEVDNLFRISYPYNWYSYSTWTGEMNSLLWGKFAAGTYHVRVRAVSPAGPGSYLIQTYVDHAYAETESNCTAKPSSISDAWAGCQWHLENTRQFGLGDLWGSGGRDINVISVWDPDDPATMGAGINISIFDDGFDVGHEDLSENTDKSKNSRNSGNSPFFNGHHSHGTEVAGLIAARDNDVGVRGVAPRATIYGYDRTDRFIGIKSSELAVGMAHQSEVTAISNNSWSQGRSPLPKTVTSAWETAVRNGVTSGYGGKGIFYVFAAGNGYREGDEANLDEVRNFYAVTPVCAVNYNDRRAIYSNVDEPLWVCAPSGHGRGVLPRLTTTTNGRYTDSFEGTSAAAPIVSGVAALVRAANTELTWRDVKLVLAGSARQNDSTHPRWEQGAAKYGAVGNYLHNDSYGFGVVDAAAAVGLAKQWVNLPPMVEQSSASGGELVITDLVDGAERTPVTATVTMGSGIDFIEFVELNTDWDHDSIRDLKIELVSPAGTTTEILAMYLTSRPDAFREAFRFGAARFLGESAAGDWTLRITDGRVGGSGKLKSWSLKVYGHKTVPPVPQSTSATAGSNKLTIGWSAPAVTGPGGVNSYDLRHRRADEPDADWTETLDIATTHAATYDLTGLRGGVQYELQIRAENASGAGPWTDTFTGTTTDVSPAAPAITSVTARARELRVSWSPPLDGSASTSSYDLRHITSNSTPAEKLVDANWTVTASAWTTGGGELEASISSLTDGEQYDVQIRATNAIGTSAWSATTTGTPISPNQDPEFAAASVSRTVAENTASGDVGAAIAASDADRDSLTYSATEASADGADDLAAFNEDFDLDAATGQVSVKPGGSIDYEDRSTYVVDIGVTDAKNPSGAADTAIDDKVTLTITVTDVEEIDAAEFDAAGLEAVVLASFDAAGSQTLWSDAGSRWGSQGALVAGDVALDDDSSVVRVMVPNRNGSLLRLNDDGPLVMRAFFGSGGDGADLTVWLKTAAGTASFAAGDVRTAGSNYVNFNVPASERAVLAGISAGDRFVLALTRPAPVTEDPANAAPAFADSDDDGTADAVALTIAENTASGDVGSAVAADEDGDTLTYSVTQTADQDAAAHLAAFNRDFSLDAASGQISVRPGAAIDYETRPSYKVLLGVADSKNAAGETDSAIDDTAVLTVTVTNANEAGAVTITGTVRAGETLTAQLDDPDGAASSLAWQWSRATAAEGPFNVISGETASTYDIESDDAGKFLQATVTYTDTTHNARGQSAAAVGPAVAANAAPSFADSDDDGTADAVTLTIAENTASGDVGSAVTAADEDGDTLTYSVTQTADQDAAAHLAAFNRDFSLDAASGQISVRPGAAIDYETRPSYKVLLGVADSKNAAGETDSAIDDTAVLTVTVTNVNEAGSVSVSGVVIEGETLTGSLVDPDGATAALAWRWASAQSQNGAYTDISSATAASYKVGAGDVGKYLRATVTYSDTTHSATGQSAAAAVGPAVAANAAPSFADSDDDGTADAVTLTIAENTASGDVGSAVTAADEDGDTLTYSVTQTADQDAAAHLAAFNRDFSLDAVSGQVSVKPGAAIDYETRPSYKVTVGVSDSKDASGGLDTSVDDAAVLTVTVANVNEAGSVAITGTVKAGETLTALLDDPDGATSGVTWQWSRATAAEGPFSVISGETASTYDVETGDVGKFLQATVTYTDTTHNAAGQTATAATGEVAAADDATTPTETEAAVSVSEPAEGDLSAGTDTSGVVAPDSAARGEIVEVDGWMDIDWFAAELAAGTTYAIEMLGAPTTDCTIWAPLVAGIRDSTGAWVRGTEWHAAGRSSYTRLEFTPNTAGTYYVAVTGEPYPGVGEGRYLVALTEAGAGRSERIAAIGAQGCLPSVEPAEGS